MENYFTSQEEKQQKTPFIIDDSLKMKLPLLHCMLSKKYQNEKSLNKKRNITLFLNSAQILINNIHLLPDLFTYNKETSDLTAIPPKYDAYINLTSNGKIKPIHYSNCDFQNIFSLWYSVYDKFLIDVHSIQDYCIENVNECIQDITGWPVYQYNLRNEIHNELLCEKLESIVRYSGINNTILLLVTDIPETGPVPLQYLYEIISVIHFKRETLYKIQICKIYQTPKNKRNVLGAYSYPTLSKRNDITKAELLAWYPNESKSNPYIEFTYLTWNELWAGFNSILEIRKYPYTLKLNGKFINNSQTPLLKQFDTRWYYTFNITKDDTEICFGIHNIDLVDVNYSDSYIGWILLKSNMWNLTFVDYIDFKNMRDNYLKSILKIGSYIIVPILTQNNDPPRIIKKRELAIKKNNKDYLSNYSRKVVNEIFERFDINKDEVINKQKLIIWIDYINKNTNSKITEEMMNKYVKSEEIQISTLKLLFNDLLAAQGRDALDDIFNWFGYENGVYGNMKSKVFYVSFNSDVTLDIKIGDSLSFNINSIAYEWFIVQFGKTANIEKTNSITLHYYNMNEEILFLMLENLSRNRKKVIFLLKQEPTSIELKYTLPSQEKKFLCTYISKLNTSELRYEIRFEE